MPIKVNLLSGSDAGSTRSIKPGHEPPHPLLVAGILAEPLSEPAFFPTSLGIKQQGQSQGGNECGPASPNQCPAKRAAEHRRIKRMPDESIDACLDQPGARGGLWKRRQVSA